MPFPEGYYNFQVSGYDVFSQRPNNGAPDHEFLWQARNPQVFGEFVWTGFDYLGEPSPYEALPQTMKWQSEADQARWAGFLAKYPKQSPARSSYYGIVDLCGFPKDRYYAYQAQWRPDLRMAHLLPHWTWPGREGQKVPVHVYTSGDEAELFLNGRSLGRKAKAPETFRLQWNSVVYEPGEVRVTAYRKGQKWAEDAQRTAGAPCRLEVRADRDPIAGDGADLCYVTICVQNARRNLVPRADPLLRFSVSGPVEMAGVCNGDATDLTGFQASQQRAYNGLCLVILRGRPGQRGTGVLTVRADDKRLPEATVRIRVR
jgi:beta-galactosidase